MFDFVELKVRKMRNLWYLVACGELSSLLALLAKKSFKSKQIKQIYFERFEKICEISVTK